MFGEVKKITPDIVSQGDGQSGRLLERINAVQGLILRCKFP